MGNCQAGGMFTSRNKEFQAVMPFPNDGSEPSQNGKKRKLSPQKSSKTAPSPNNAEEAANGRRDSQTDVDSSGELSKHQRFGDPVSIGVKSTSGMNGDIANGNSSADGSYLQTESQQRRERMADCEFECSRITSYLYVGGYHVATNREVLRLNGISHIINCSAAVVENAFAHDTSLKYLSLSMVDGRQDDISWFLCEVVQFIMKARAVGGRVLVHCEKGISRSCSFAIAYRMWATGDKWKACFDYVKRGRSICSPNTAFTCNLIELGELLGKDAARTGAGGNLLFRCAYHLPHDPKTAVLKLCRTADSRKIMVPATSLLDPKGVFVIRTVSSHDASVQRTASQHRLFLWQGAEASDGTAKRAEALAKKMYGVLTTTDRVEWVKHGEENLEFLSYLVDDGAFNSSDNSLFDDFYDYPPSEEQTLQSIRQMEADHTRNNNDNFKIPTPVRESSIKGFADFSPGPMSRESSMRSQPIYQLSRESSTRRGSGTGNVDMYALLARHKSGNAAMMSDAASKDTIATVSTQATAATGNGHGPPNASRTRMDSESPSVSNTNSRRNSDAVTPFTRIPSLQLTAGAEESKGSSAPSPSEVSINSKRKLIPELAIGPKGGLHQMQRVSEGDMNSSDLSSSRLNSSRDNTARDNGGSEVRGAAAVTPRLLQKQTSGGASKITLPALTLQKSTSPKPSELALNLPSHSTMGSHSGSKVALPLATSAATSDADNLDPPMLQRRGSEEKMKLRISPVKIAPTGSADGSAPSASHPASASGVSPLAGIGQSPVAERRSSGAGQSPVAERRLSGAAAGTGQSPLAERRSSGTGQSPVADRRFSGAAASLMALASHGTSSNTNSAANLHAALPLKVLERSPSTDRHPQDVGLSRGPTSVEDLHSQRGRAPSQPTNLLLPTQVDPAYMQRSASQQSGVAVLTKPALFQAVQKDGGGYEWHAMGVYDDEDLDEASLFILLCPNGVHKIWLGAAFEGGIEVTDEEDVPSDASVVRWASEVSPGEVRLAGAVGTHLLANSDVSVERGGEESEDFWQDFNDGY